MGCDIHAYVEYAYPQTSAESEYWQCLVSNAGSRDYALFGLLAGVRSDLDPVTGPRGLPEGKLSWETQSAVYLRVTDDPTMQKWDGYCSPKQAESWGEPAFELNGIEYIFAPDYHTHSWITADELAIALGRYMVEVCRNYHVEWDAILAAMRALEDRGMKTRIVFWFDN